MSFLVRKIAIISSFTAAMLLLTSICILVCFFQPLFNYRFYIDHSPPILTMQDFASSPNPSSYTSSSTTPIHTFPTFELTNLILSSGLVITSSIIINAFAVFFQVKAVNSSSANNASDGRGGDDDEESGFGDSKMSTPLTSLTSSTTSQSPLHHSSPPPQDQDSPLDTLIKRLTILLSIYTLLLLSIFVLHSRPDLLGAFLALFIKMYCSLSLGSTDLVIVYR